MRTKKRTTKNQNSQSELSCDPLGWTDDSIRAWLDATHRAGLYQAGDERFDERGEPSF